MAVSGKVFLGADNITECLNEKYSSFKSPRYVIKTILEKELETAQKEARRIKVKAIENSSLFCVMVFQPHNDIIKCAKRLCICDECQTEYGSCASFISKSLEEQTVHTQWLQIQKPAEKEDDDNNNNEDGVQDEEEDDDYDSEYIYDFLQPGSYVAVAPDINIDSPNDNATCNNK